jgi:uronate dehydrogenase
MKRILMTGARGGVGTMLRPMLRQTYSDVLLSDIAPVDDLARGETFTAVDLADKAAVAKLCKGVDGILHFGGFSVEGPWDTIHQANIVGVINLFEGAREAGVKRIVFASSNHAVGFYPRTARINEERKVLPDSRYGVSKAFGEAMGAFYAEKFGLGVLSLRIGNVGLKPIDVRRLAIWLHPEDLMQLCQIGLEHPDLKHEIFYGMSHNERAWWDNSRARAFGYKPKHRAEDHAAYALAEQAKAKPDPVGDHFQGGTFCSAEYTGPKVRG